MRLPLAVSLESRDGTVTKDAKVLNGIIETKGAPPNSQLFLRRRPGNSDLGLIDAGVGQMLTVFNSKVITVANGTVYRSTLGPLSNTSIGGGLSATLPFDSADNGLTAGATGFLFLKTTANGYVIDSTFAGPGPAGSTSYPATTVRGVVFMDGYFFVMQATGDITNCDLDANPANANTWDATSIIRAEKDNGAGVCLTRTLSYIVAFKEYSTELFWNAGNAAPGSPLSPVDGGYTQIGCASAASVTNLDGTLFWIAQTRQKGRSIYMMHGLEQQKVSTADIDRILNVDDLVTVHAFGMKLDGHPLYLVTLVTSNITLVYDMLSQQWTQWSSLTLGSSKSVTSITRVGTTATVTTSSAHGFLDGDPIKISGADQAGYNGIFQIAYVSTTVFTIEVTGSPVTPATGTILAFPYTETYFKFTKYTSALGHDLLLHESDGHLYEVLSTIYQDNLIPINTFSRSIRLDGGTDDLKKLARIRVIGDTVSDYFVMRWSDDDSATVTAYRRVDLSQKRPALRRCGAFVRRTIESRFIGNNPLRLEALELEAGQ